MGFSQNRRHKSRPLYEALMTPMPDQWYVQFDGLSYGTYAHVQMQGFVEEGRIIGSSLITPDPSRGYFEASAFPIYNQWLAHSQHLAQQNMMQPIMGQTDHMQVRQEQPAPIAVGQSYSPVARQELAPTVLVVMAEIRSAQGMPFLQALQTHGTAQRIGDTVWLLRGAISADDLRSSLSRTLSKQDRLFILDSFHNKTAWFNIGADMDQRIRELWARND